VTHAAEESLRLAISDYWDEFDPEHDALIRAIFPEGLQTTELTDVKRADLVVHSIYNTDWGKARGTTVSFIPEPFTVKKSLAHWIVDWRHDSDPNHLRLPLWALQSLSGYSSFKGDRTDPESRKFCNFIYSNGTCDIRNAFFKMLDQHSAVESLGSLFNNSSSSRLSPRTGSLWRESKIEVLGNYKFTIAFENSEHVGYTTEKLVDAWLADTVPIYWGDPAFGVDLPVNACLSLYEAGSMQRLVEQVIDVNNDPHLYEKYRQQNPFRTGAIDEVLRRFEAELSAFGFRIREDAVAHARSNRISVSRRLARRASNLQSLPRLAVQGKHPISQSSIGRFVLNRRALRNRS